MHSVEELADADAGYAMGELPEELEQLGDKGLGVFGNLRLTLSIGTLNLATDTLSSVHAEERAA